MLKDKHGRVHNYLRVSLTERCNFRCTYCMPEEGIDLTPKSHICSYEELLQIIDTFIELGVNKIRLTGGEPLVRKDADHILHELGKRPVELAITTNGLIVDRFIDVFESCGLRNVNVSLDTLDADKFNLITRRSGFDRVLENIYTLVERGFNTKINMVVMRGMNEEEIADFALLAKDLPIIIRYIEFMPFDGNRWNNEKMVSADEIRERLSERYTLIRDEDAPHDTTKHYSIDGFKGQIGVISSMSEQFCGSCNRIRLLANGSIKNCLFSPDETNLLQPLRNGDNLESIIREALYHKKAKHAGMFNLSNQKNRTMTTIGG
ncbi:MAG: GTP 3',8-cyclase MoaA [Balneolaceae bacterium]|nr:GTP 3',8-cyclase MoaA [Balneolaceae bacterium]